MLQIFAGDLSIIFGLWLSFRVESERKRRLTTTIKKLLQHSLSHINVYDLELLNCDWPFRISYLILFMWCLISINALNVWLVTKCHMQFYSYLLCLAVNVKFMWKQSVVSCKWRSFFIYLRRFSVWQDDDDSIYIVNKFRKKIVRT